MGNLVRRMKDWWVESGIIHAPLDGGDEGAAWHPARCIDDDNDIGRFICDAVNRFGKEVPPQWPQPRFPVTLDSLGHRSPNWGEYPFDEATEREGKGPDWDWTVYEGPSAHWYVIDGRATRIAIVRPDLPQERQERVVKLMAMGPQMREALQAIVDKAGDLEEAQSMAQATLDYLE